MTSIMFTAPHGTGKSTTAKALYRTLPGDFLFIPSFAGAVAKQVGFDLNGTYSTEKLVNYQWRVLSTFKISYELTSQINTIYDRSPIDFAVYMMLALQGKPEWASTMEQFNRACTAATLDYCNILIIPEANLNEGYEDKGNRPSFTKEQISVRETYSQLVDSLLSNVTSKVKVVRVPVEHQYTERLIFIRNELKGLI